MTGPPLVWIPGSAMTTLPDPSTATSVGASASAVAGMPFFTGPAPPSAVNADAPSPAGVVSWPVAGLTIRTDDPSATYRLPPANVTPAGLTPTVVALAGPPAPPATVEITPVTSLRTAAGRFPLVPACAAGTAASTPRPAATVTTGRARIRKERIATPHGYPPPSAPGSQQLVRAVSPAPQRNSNVTVLTRPPRHKSRATGRANGADA